MTSEPISDRRGSPSTACHNGTEPPEGTDPDSPSLVRILNPLSKCSFRASRELLDPEAAEVIALSLGALARTYEAEAKLARLKEDVEDQTDTLDRIEAEAKYLSWMIPERQGGSSGEVTG